MSSLPEIIKRAQKVLFCPVCKRSYRLNEIRLRGVFDGTYIFQTVCTKHHVPVVTVFVAHHDARTNEELEIVREVNGEKKSISPDDVISMHEALRDFDGDFESVFKR